MSRENDLLRWRLHEERSQKRHPRTGPGSSRVFIAQRRPRFDLETAVDYGRFITVFKEFDQFLDPAGSAELMLRKMGNFTDRDFVLAIGHPVGVAMLASAAARMNGGRVSMLVWSNDLGRYYSVQVDLGAAGVPQREVQL